MRFMEVAAATAIERLLAERLAVKDVMHLTGLDQATVRRLRQIETDDDEPGTEFVTSGGVDTTAEGADAEVASWRARRRQRSIQAAQDGPQDRYRPGCRGHARRHRLAPLIQAGYGQGRGQGHQRSRRRGNEA